MKHQLQSIFRNYPHLCDEATLTNLLDKENDKNIKRNRKLIIEILYEDFQKLIPKPTIKKALKKVGLI